MALVVAWAKDARKTQITKWTQEIKCFILLNLIFKIRCHHKILLTKYQLQMGNTDDQVPLVTILVVHNNQNNKLTP